MIPAIIQGGKTVFQVAERKITFSVPETLISKLLLVCDGTRSLEKVIRLLGIDWNKECLRGLLKELIVQEVVTDSRNLSRTIWKLIKNPSYFPTKITSQEIQELVLEAQRRHRKTSSKKEYPVSSSSFRNLLNHRRSVRHFSTRSLSLQTVVEIAWSAYGETIAGNRTVPSAGALYPLVVHLVLLKTAGELRPGIYEVILASAQKVGFKLISSDIGKSVRSFLDPLTLRNAQGVIVVSGSFEYTGKKYGNRSALYVTLEAGHVAQNIHCASSELGVGTFEVGGFVEDLLSESLMLAAFFCPLTTVVFGFEEENLQAASEDILKIEVVWALPIAGKYRLPFCMAFAKQTSDSDDNWSCGRAGSPELAYTKAVSEAKERIACGIISPELTYSKFSDLEGAIDPRSMVRFDPVQYSLRQFPFNPFNEDLVYAWVEGKDELTGHRVYVLADNVYFPYTPETPRFVHASSSGVSAHPDKNQAIKNGVLELVERDSFMIAYLARLIFPTVIATTVARKIQSRIKDIRENGFDLWIKDISLDLAPVIFVFAQSKDLGFTTCAACSDFNSEAALDHALMEIESAVLHRLSHNALKPISLQKVRSPSDHGRLYEQKSLFRKADFMVYGSKKLPFRNVGLGAAQSWEGLLEKFRRNKWKLITVPLYVPGEKEREKGLHVVRSIVPGMVPISFGYQEIPGGMPRIYETARKFGKKTISYHTLSHFPHPYT